MTSPDFPGAEIPPKTWTPSTVFNLQNVDPEQWAIDDNAETYDMAEAARQAFFTVIYSAVEQIPIIGGLIGDVIEIITGVEDGDLDDLGTWVSNLGDFVGNIIGEVLHAVLALLGWIPTPGPGLGGAIDGLAGSLDQTHSTAATASTNAGAAVSAATAAVNAAANAAEVADIAYANSTTWFIEFVAASAEVDEGGNELLVGPMLVVRDDQTAIMTDVKIAFLEQHGGLEVETRKWNAAGTAYTVAHTGMIDPNVTRRSFSGLSVPVADEERFFPYVNDIVGTVPPTVMQIAVSGVWIPA
ncbi:hypothetical protein [Nocardia abscessus]|uniref:hypothetical protein n=1 Tax=Nocardia abscessus TaxID=120957 RepID=UPI002456BDB2|nr:hypothetical protein [Nocardia abscessus]